MYHYLRGTLVLLTNEYAVIDCGGVGYRLSISAFTFSKIASQMQKETTLYSYLAVREDALDLYGFSDEDELALFRLLISVSGIGPKGALAVLSVLSPDQLRSAIASGDAKSISRAQGVGGKTAQRVIMELKDKIGSVSGVEISSGFSVQSGSTASQVIDTLTLYGFERHQIEAVLRNQDLSQPLEVLIADTLRILGSM